MAFSFLCHKDNTFSIITNARSWHDLDADLDCESGVTAIQSKILNEKIDGKIYPRPAITRNGIVFSYQTYEKGSNADGTLHFIVPFNGDTIKDNK